ncbi:MAG: protein phosphatase 2C domain-containing protein [Candidatus Hermodarchaeia archaeon]|jgi:hypothetical protein
MNSDSYFRIGNAHQVCEDYALSGKTEDRAFAVMSDGCSGSPRTDFGARFLALAMEQILTNEKMSEEEIGGIHMMGLNLARLMSSTSGLGDACLDATLGFVFTDKHFFRAFLSGDGAIAALKRNGEKWCGIIEYPSGAPPYLSYSLDEERVKYYLEQTEGCPFTLTVHEWTNLESVSTTVNENEGMNSHAFAFPRDEYELVMVMSDGVGSFQKPIHSETTRYFEPVDAIRIVDELLAVKSYNGDFMKRRYKRVIKNLCIKSGWKHLDDISVAAVHAEGIEDEGKV